eukprot:gb/GEZN01011385.1/.p1 GENE.gb/GEZN01011385.1/~~gb/GEZN01011385.1/.p1  ORF type:complete len:284 (+),score=40.95 gb/GEZN01011385.1/:32-853(+)
MAHYLPPAVLAMFAPRPPIPYKAPVELRKMPPPTGCAEFIERAKQFNLPEPVKNPSPAELREKKLKKRKLNAEKRKDIHIAKWDPQKVDESATKDAYKTLFVARLSYDVSEEDLKDEFEYYGPISKVKIVKVKEGPKKDKPRGYGFVEFERSNDLKEAYKDADGRKVKGRRILVDVERGRTVRNWQPRRLGGGLGGTRLGGDDVNQKFSGREPPKSSSSRRGASSRRSDRDRTRERPREGGDRDRRGGDRDKDRSKDDRDKGRDRDRERRPRR